MARGQQAWSVRRRGRHVLTSDTEVSRVSRVNRSVVASVASVVVVSLAAASCALVAESAPLARPAVERGRPCAASAMRSCALPYPSDEFTISDPASATGLRVNMPAEVLPAGLLSSLGPGATPAAAFSGADGFSALTPVMFEMDRAVDPASIPVDGGDVVAVYDTATGARVPLRVEVPVEAGRHGAPDTMVVAWPVVRYEYGHTYVARVSDEARARSGELQRAPGLDAPDADGVSTQARLRATLAAAEGDQWTHVLSATSFTVRSADNASGELDGMNQIVRAADHPIRNLVVQLPYLVPNASAVVEGEVRLTDFRDADGVARAANPPTETWAKFELVLPTTPAGAAGAPVVIYGHGLTAAKETMLATADTNAQHGMATIGIDVPNHGDRQGGSNGGYLLDIANPHDFGRLASMPLQGIADQISLLLAVQQHLGSVELRLADLPGRVGAPAPRLDVEHIFYEGTSMGGVLGAAFTALAPELDGSFLQVAGTGIADTIFHSLLWILFMQIIPQGASTGDAYALMGAATMLTDPADNVNVVDRIRTHDTPTYLVYGVGDGVVPNYISDRFITLTDLPLVGRQLTPITTPHRTAGDTMPADGFGATQIWPTAAPDTQSFLAHLSFSEPAALDVLGNWLQGRLWAEGIVPG